MGRIYTVLLLAAQGLDSILELTAAAGYITVLRCFDVYWGGGTTGSPSVRLIGSSGQTIVEFHAEGPSPPAAIDSHSWHWEGRQALPPGSTWAVEVAGPPADVSVTGYQLVDTGAGP